MSKTSYEFISDGEDDELLKDLPIITTTKPFSSSTSSSKPLIPDLFDTPSGLPSETTAEEDYDLDSNLSSSQPVPSSPLLSSPVSSKSVSPIRRRSQTNFLAGANSKGLSRSASSPSTLAESNPKKRAKRGAAKATNQPSLNDFFPPKKSTASGTKQSSLNEFFNKGAPRTRGSKKAVKGNNLFDFKVSEDTMKLVNSLNALEALEHEDELEREKVRSKVAALRELEESTLADLTQRIVSNGFNGATVPGPKVWPGAGFECTNTSTKPKKSTSSRTSQQRRGAKHSVQEESIDDLVAKRFDVARETARIMYREKTDPGGSDYRTCKDFYLLAPIYVPYKCDPPSNLFGSGNASGPKLPPWGVLSYATTPHFAVESGTLLRKLNANQPDEQSPTKLPLPVWTWILFSFMSSPQAANDAIINKYVEVLTTGYNATEWDHVDTLRQVFASVGLSIEIFDNITALVFKKDTCEHNSDQQSPKSALSQFNFDTLLKPVLGPRYVFPQVQAVKMATRVALGIVEQVAAAVCAELPQTTLESLQQLVFVLLALISTDASLLSQISQLDLPVAFARLLSTVSAERWTNDDGTTTFDKQANTNTTTQSCPTDLLPFLPTIAPKYKDTFCYSLVNTIARVLPPSQVILRSRFLESLSETSSAGRMFELRQYLATAFFTTSTFDMPQGASDLDTYADPLEFYFDPEDIAATVERTILPIMFRDPVLANARAYGLELVTRKALDPYLQQGQTEGVRNIFESRRAALLSSWRDNTNTLTGLAETRTRLCILCTYVLHHLVRVAEPLREALIHRLQEVTRVVLQLLRAGPGGAGIKDGHEDDEDEDDEDKEGDEEIKVPDQEIMTDLDEPRSPSVSSPTSSPSRLSEDPEPVLGPCVVVRAAGESPTHRKSASSRRSSALAAALAFAQAQPEVRRKILPAVMTTEVSRVSRRPQFLHEGLTLDIAAASVLQELRDLRPAEDGYSAKTSTASRIGSGYATPMRREGENGDNEQGQGEEDEETKMMPPKKKMKVVSFDEDTKMHDGKEAPEVELAEKKENVIMGIQSQKPVNPTLDFDPAAPPTGVRPKRRVIHRRRPEVVQS
ncbi:uncharacterized protein SAPINGB_P003665 [Magnusiomyces paraingens]|uniref:Uncharacterized protein n=1 Tax=Magnusiomyces paraingens TaxID=2606893 RepID=A0A5E8BSS8_9ASCO|nr:uncharacterized protein SAPINGB_P003665 [Saprochaete ingens]VVT53619.1 unnamed protein product [Saprochaete ingens]